MDFNYTLRYKTFNQLLEEVLVDLRVYSLENMIDPQQLIKVARRVNYDLGLRINQTKETIVEVCHGKAKLPDDFYTFNFAFICGEFQVQTGYDIGGTTIMEVPYVETPSTVNFCSDPTVNCSVCNSNPCNHTAGCEANMLPINPIPTEYDPNNPYGDTCIRPRVFMNCKGEQYELIQIVNASQTRIYRDLIPLRMKSSQEIECDCPNLYYNTANEAWIKHGFIFTNLSDAKIYLNYQGSLEDDEGNLLVPDHELLNEYYEYALKQRILENLYMNGEDVVQKLQLIEQRLRTARVNALSLVNTPNFKELEKVWWSNRKAMYGKYYNMFKSYSPVSSFYKNFRYTVR